MLVRRGGGREAAASAKESRRHGGERERREDVEGRRSSKGRGGNAFERNKHTGLFSSVDRSAIGHVQLQDGPCGLARASIATQRSRAVPASTRRRAERGERGRDAGGADLRRPSSVVASPPFSARSLSRWHQATVPSALELCSDWLLLSACGSGLKWRLAMRGERERKSAEKGASGGGRGEKWRKALALFSFCVWKAESERRAALAEEKKTQPLPLSFFLFLSRLLFSILPPLPIFPSHAERRQQQKTNRKLE